MTKESYNFGVDTEAKRLYTKTSGMTEKRFTITQDFEEHHRQIRDNGKIIMGCFLEPQAEPIVKLLNELHEENKELKETIDELRTIDKEKDIEVAHINNIYKAFGFKGLMDYAKDKLYNFGTVREVEEGLWLLATGGWSDNEFWLDCLLDWSFMYAKGHYRATTRGGRYYYSEKPYADIKVILED